MKNDTRDSTKLVNKFGRFFKILSFVLQDKEKDSRVDYASSLKSINISDQIERRIANAERERMMCNYF